MKTLFTKNEIRLLRSLKSPERIQNFLSDLPYHEANTAFSPRQVMEKRTAHCLEGAAFAAAALRFHGYPPLILDLEAENDSDHVLAVYRERGAWGSIAASSFTGLRGREPVYKSLRELAMSYFNDYFNLRRERTLRAFSQPVNLKRFDTKEWMIREDNIWFIAEYLCEIPHTPLLTPTMRKKLSLVDARALAAGKYSIKSS